MAKAITLVESSRPDHRDRADELLSLVLPNTGRSHRIGVSGTPGVGKSSLIERLGHHVIELGQQVAVLAVDPSSRRTGGSILGDKTRMPFLATHPASFVRPSPSRGVLGGVADATREVVLLCEAAGFGVVIVETVGVGQSETAVADITDLFVLLVAPGGGDDLQGIKRGVMELADVVVVNKADGPYLATASHTAADYRAALHLVRPKREGITTDVLLCSALNGSGVVELWDHLVAAWQTLHDLGALTRLRSDQAVDAMWRIINTRLLTRIQANPELLDPIVHQVARGTLPASKAAALVLASVAPTTRLPPL